MHSERPAWKQLISHTLTTDERTSLIVKIFSDPDEVEMVEHLSGDDAQAFIDAATEVSSCDLALDGWVGDPDANLHILSIRH